jgi:hypothetical protein
MLPPHLRNRDLNRLTDLARAGMRTMRPVGQPGKLPGQIPRYPPVQRRPVHSRQGSHLHHVSAIQDRANRIQALLDNQQDNQCQSRPPQPDAPRKTSHPG